MTAAFLRRTLTVTMSPIARLDTLANEAKRAFELVTASYFAHLGTLGRNSDTLGGNATDVRPSAHRVRTAAGDSAATCEDFSWPGGNADMTGGKRRGNYETTMARHGNRRDAGENVGADGVEPSHWGEKLRRDGKKGLYPAASAAARLRLRSDQGGVKGGAWCAEPS